MTFRQPPSPIVYYSFFQNSNWHQPKNYFQSKIRYLLSKHLPLFPLYFHLPIFPQNIFCCLHIYLPFSLSYFLPMFVHGYPFLLFFISTMLPSSSITTLFFPSSFCLPKLPSSHLHDSTTFPNPLNVLFKFPTRRKKERKGTLIHSSSWLALGWSCSTLTPFQILKH